MFKVLHEICLTRLVQRLDSRGLEAEICLSAGVQSVLNSEANGRHTLYSWPTSRMSRWTGSLGMRSSVDAWYRLISRSATVPGRKRRRRGLSRGIAADCDDLGVLGACWEPPMDLVITCAPFLAPNPRGNIGFFTVGVFPVGKGICDLKR